jgi:hypothetical protein
MTMATLRRWHFYVGMFIAPSVLFFALTGALQIFSLHEAHGAYTPPPLIEKLSSVHKDQVFAARHRRPPGPKPATAAKPAPAPAKPAGDGGDTMKLSTMLLKWFFLAVAIGLACSTGLGLWIGLTHPINRRTGWALVAAGAVIPILLILV